MADCLMRGGLVAGMSALAVVVSAGGCGRQSVHQGADDGALSSGDTGKSARQSLEHPAASSAPSAPSAPMGAPAPDASADLDATLAGGDAERALRERVVRSHVDDKQNPADSPERFARSMTGTVDCGVRKCRAGQEVCVSSPSEAHVSHCEPIRGWIDQRTPRPRDGFPPLAGITACSGSHNCPSGSVCCLHQIGSAEIQAIVCHANLSECRDRTEICREGVKGDCRTAGTRCVGYQCTQP